MHAIETDHGANVEAATDEFVNNVSGIDGNNQASIRATVTAASSAVGV